MHYLDHNATSPLRPEARAAIERALAIGGNRFVGTCARPYGARALVEEARDKGGARWQAPIRRRDLHQRRHRSQCAGAVRRGRRALPMQARA